MISSVICIACLLSAGSARAAGVFFDETGKTLQSPPARPSGSVPVRHAQASVPPGIVLPEDVSYVFYPVSGRTFSEVVQSAAENGPLRRGKGGRTPSSLSWAFGLSFSFDSSPEVNEEDSTVHAAITVRDVAFEYFLVMTLPELLDNTSLNPVELELWKNFVRRLVDEEKGRISIIKDPDMRGEAEGSLADIDYVIFEYAPEMDIQGTISAFLLREGEKAGQEMSSNIRRKLSEYDRRAGRF